MWECCGRRRPKRLWAWASAFCFPFGSWLKRRAIQWCAAYMGAEVAFEPCHRAMQAGL